jgi:cytosine/adenosine deaminase-related metal-dependent hydrolase
LLLTGSVLVPGKVLRGGQVAVDGSGVIQCVGCDCSQAATATQVSCPKGVISPGLINPHDHIAYTQNSPASDSGERYEQRNDWRKGLRGHTALNTPGGASADEMHWGELRFLMGGATSTIGSGGTSGFLRNLDASADLEGLDEPEVDNDTFPLNDSNGAQLTSGCAYPGLPTINIVKYDHAYQAHVSEGIDAVARNEFLCLSGASGGEVVTLPQSSFVHGVALAPADFQAMAAAGTALVWSPRSNIRLYGDTANVATAARLGVQIALGTDWTATGSMNLLRELACADGWNKDRLERYFSDEQLWLMVTRNAAYSVNNETRIGTLAPGLIGDIAIFNSAVNSDHRAIIAAQPQDVVLVLRAGKPLYGDATLMGALPASGCDALDVCGTMKSVCAMSETGKTLAALTSANAKSYAAFFCATPDNEPTCTPKRSSAVTGSTVYDGSISASDSDGDGIPDAQDNCPHVFNPVRPLDGGKQADGDGDGVGDACDPCPMASGAGCMSVNPEDIDSDGIPDERDNCVGVANADQADADADGRGDVCDACANTANPYPLGCPSTVYDVKTGVVPMGSQVSIKNLIVTAVIAKSGFFVQVKETDGAAYKGPENSGLFIYSPSGTAPKVGNRVDIIAGVSQTFYGEVELTAVTFTITNASVEMAPAPVTAVNSVTLTPAMLATGGSEAAALEGVIVGVANVNVNDVAPAPGPGDTAPTNEYVAGGVRVDDLFYLTSPFPTVDANFATLQGVLVYRNGNSKIEPRNANDVVLVPVLTGLGPNAFTRVGTVSQTTIPASAPMLVTLSSAAIADTPVTLSVADADKAYLTVDSPVTIKKGDKSAPIAVSGIALKSMAATTVITVTASLNGVNQTGTVRVLGATDAPTLTAITPSATKVTLGGKVTLNVVLDIPAPAGFAAINLDVTNGWMLSASSVTVMQDALLGAFDVTQAGANSSATVTATQNPGAGQVTAQATLTVGQNTANHLVINEVDYDNASTDDHEYVELYNPTDGPVDLTNLAIVTATTSTTAFQKTFPLGGSTPLGAKQFLVLGSTKALALVPPTAMALTFKFPADTDQLANGPPTGIALINTATKTVIDSVSFGGKATVTPAGWSAPVVFYEGSGTMTLTDSKTVEESLIRKADGVDNDDTASDWAISTTRTPGTTNTP